ncbi:hypothetical protein CcaCcLH18_11322 [Colletotrichum camelliae]|nr:hypothetical protein CcaCcLH18_11322 [Colletotrichum camelliae]
MPAVTRSQSTRRPSDSPPPGLQPTPRRRCRRSITKTEPDNNTNDNDETENEPDNTTKDDHTAQAIQLNLPLALPAPFNRQLLSLCFHASWRTRRRLRIHFSNRSEVLLDDTSSSEDDDSEHHDNLTVISYAPIAVPSHPPTHRWLIPLIIASLIAITLIAAALRHPLQLHDPPPPRPRPITLRNLTSLVHPYARLLRLLDTAPTAVLPGVQREFAELCALARPLALPADACHDIVDLLDDAGVHLARVVGGIRVMGPGNLGGALRDTVLLMAWGIDQQRQRQEQEETQDEGAGGGAWNATAEGIFRAVAAQMPNWWDDHNALAVPVQAALEALRAARGAEGDVLSAFKRGVGSLDPNEL